MMYVTALTGAALLSLSAGMLALLSLLTLVAALSGALLPWVSAGALWLLWASGLIASALGMSGNALGKHLAATAPKPATPRLFARIGAVASAVAVGLAVAASILAALADRDSPPSCISWRSEAASAALAASQEQYPAPECLAP